MKNVVFYRRSRARTPTLEVGVVHLPHARKYVFDLQINKASASGLDPEAVHASTELVVLWTCHPNS